MGVSQLKISELKFGHDEGAPPTLNIRKTERDTGIKELAMSIATYGLINPLIVAKNGSGYYTLAGNRRLAALRYLVETGQFGNDELIPVVERDIDVADVGLAENVMREDLHPVDKFEAYSDALDRMGSKQQVCLAYGLKPKELEQTLALAALAPKIREAWRKGVIDDEQAQAFTLAADQKQQVEVFDKLTKSRALWPHAIRHAIVGDQQSTTRNLKLVGIEAYKAAGGSVTEDLFSGRDTENDAHVVNDPALLKKLADKALQDECDKLVKAGWGWAKVRDEANPWDFDKITAKTKAEKAGAGCIVTLAWDGTLQIEKGFVPKKSARQKEVAKAKAEGKPLPAPGISNALHQRLSEQLTAALMIVLAEHPTVALAAAVAAPNSHDAPVDIEVKGLAQKQGKVLNQLHDFAPILRKLLKMNTAQLLKELAAVIATGADVQSFNAASTLPTDATLALCDAIPAKAMQKALAATFDAKDYFASASKTVCQEALAETYGKAEAAKLASGTKAEVAAYCTTHLTKKGWLPRELRTASYSGPGARKRAKK